MLIIFPGPLGSLETEIYDSPSLEEEWHRRTKRVGSEELLCLRPTIWHYWMDLSEGYRLVMGWWN
jgi:hypothetical protein